MKRSTAQPAVLRAIVGSAALALCLSAAPAISSSAHTQPAQPAAATSAVPFADVTIEEGSLYAFVGVNDGTAVKAMAGEDIVIQMPDVVDVSSAAAHTDIGSGLTVTSDNTPGSKSVTITVPILLGHVPELVTITGLSIPNVSTVESGFSMTLDGAGQADVSAEIDLTSTRDAALTIDEDEANKITLPALMGEEPIYGTTGNPTVTLKDGSSNDITAPADFAGLPGSFTLTPAGSGAATLTLFFEDSSTAGWNDVTIKQAVTIQAAAQPTATQTSDPTATPAVSSDTWVNAVFDDLLGREPTDIESAIWTARLDADTTDPHTIALELTRTDEWRAGWIQENYQAWLDRAGTPNGVAYWQRWMDRGLSPQGVQIKFLASDRRWSKADGDSTKWITGLYLDVLNRAPTDGLLAHWNKRLNTGWSRSRAAQEFVLHRDFLFPLVDEEYQYMLNKNTIAPARVNHWVQRLQKKARYERLIAGLAGTRDYEARLPPG